MVENKVKINQVYYANGEKIKLEHIVNLFLHNSIVTALFFETENK